MCIFIFIFLRIRRQPGSTRTDTLCPYTSLFRSVLRWRNPGADRPFRVPLYPLLPAIFCLTCVSLLYSILAYTGPGPLAGVATVPLCGFLFLFLTPALPLDFTFCMPFFILFLSLCLFLFLLLSPHIPLLSPFFTLFP